MLQEAFVIPITPRLTWIHSENRLSMLLGQPFGSYHVADPVVHKMFRVNWYACSMEHVATEEHLKLLGGNIHYEPGTHLWCCFFHCHDFQVSETYYQGYVQNLSS